MKRISAILTAAATLALGACASENMNFSDTRGPDAGQSLTTNTDTGVMAQTPRTEEVTRLESIHEGVPDNPQLGGGNDKNVTQGLSEMDRKFLIAVIQSGQYEVNASEKALLKSENAGVRTLAQHMIDDHMKVNGQATNLASRRGLRSPIGLSTDHIDKLAQLDRLNGAAFDAEYLRQQKMAHDDAIALFSAAASSANDKFIRDWAAETVPALRNHREMIDIVLDNQGTISLLK